MVSMASFISSQYIRLRVKIQVLMNVLPLLLLHDVVHYLGDSKVVFPHHHTIHPGHHKAAGRVSAPASSPAPH